MFEWLGKYERDDGGWNCETEDYRNGETVHHSSFMSKIEPLWALSTLDRQKWPKGGREAAGRAAECRPVHRTSTRHNTGQITRPERTQLTVPMFYFSDI